MLDTAPSKSLDMHCLILGIGEIGIHLALQGACFFWMFEGRQFVQAGGTSD